MLEPISDHEIGASLAKRPSKKSIEMQKAAVRAAKLFDTSIENVHIIDVGKDKIAAFLGSNKEVYILPRHSTMWISQCKRNIDKEYAFVERLSAELFPDDKKHLFIEWKKKGNYYLQPYADGGTLDKKINSNIDSATRVDYCKQILTSFYCLHRAGRIHGDVKSDNFFIHEGVVRLADFGKATQVLGDEQNGIYQGNTRFGPPEGMRSKKGDVYGAAFCIIQMLEEEFLQGNQSLIKVNEKKVPMPDAGRKGIERFVLEHKAFKRTYETNGSGFKGKALNMKCRVQAARGKWNMAVNKPNQEGKKRIGG